MFKAQLLHAIHKDSLGAGLWHHEGDLALLLFVAGLALQVSALFKGFVGGGKTL